MAEPRKRIWVDARGKTHTAWQIDYRDQNGKRRQPQYKTYERARAKRREAQRESEEGVHVLKREALTFAQVVEKWLEEDIEVGAALKRQARRRPP